MNNRHRSFPILSGIVVSLVLSPLFLQAADSTAPTNEAPPSMAPSAPPPAAASEAPATTNYPVAAPVVPAPAAAPAERPATYTVVSGDSLWVIAQKFETSIKKLKKLNNLKNNHLKPGQVLQIPPAKADASTPPPKTTSHHPATHPSHPEAASSFASAHPVQPAQDFHAAALTYVPAAPVVTTDSTTTTPALLKLAPVAKEPHYLRAEPVSLADLQQAPVAPLSTVTDKSLPAKASVATTFSSKHSTSLAASEPASLAPTPKLTGRQANPLFTTPSNAWGNRFLNEARDLGNKGIAYDEDWRPPGEAHDWTMDCSNTARYIYKVTTGIQLPRTASDQYYYLHQQNKAWDAPQAANGFADCAFLRQNLKPGDLLFWENTYKPQRQPPITHVMVFLGTNAKGQWIMAGSQTSRGGEHNRSHGGPDIYVFNPTKPCGGYSTWLGLVHHQGRFCAFGRPLDADAAKLAVAAND